MFVCNHIKCNDTPDNGGANATTWLVIYKVKTVKLKAGQVDTNMSAEVKQSWLLKLIVFPTLIIIQPYHHVFFLPIKEKKQTQNIIIGQDTYLLQTLFNQVILAVQKTAATFGGCCLFFQLYSWYATQIESQKMNVKCLVAFSVSSRKFIEYVLELQWWWFPLTLLTYKLVHELKFCHNIILVSPSTCIIVCPLLFSHHHFHLKYHFHDIPTSTSLHLG